MSLCKVYCHVVMCTKGRVRWIDESWEFELYEAFTSSCEARGVAVLRINGVQDHIHALVRMAPDMTLSALARRVKRATSDAARVHCPPFRWQRGWYVSSVSERSLGAVVKYIDAQKQRHSTTRAAHTPSSQKASVICEQEPHSKPSPQAASAAE